MAWTRKKPATGPTFESLTPIFPDKRFDLETDRGTSPPA